MASIFGDEPAPDQPAAQPDGMLMDAAKAIPRGIRKGYEGLAGIGGDFYNMEVSVAEKLAQWMGASPETLAEIRAARGQNILPTTEDVQRTTTDPIFGKAGEAQTSVGQGLETAASFLPGAGRSLFRTVVAPAIGTEAGGKIGEAMGYEGTGRFIGGVLGGVAPGATARSIAGPVVSPERRRQIGILQDEGVPLTAGQATGRKALQYAETGPYEGKPAATNAAASSAFTRAALRRAGINADAATPDVMAEAQAAFGREYDDIVTRSNGVPMDSVLQNELLDTVTTFQGLKSTGAPRVIEDAMNKLADAAQANGGVVPPEVFQVIRSDIGRLRTASADPEVRHALGRIQDSLFDSIERNGQPEIAAQARDVNNRYRNFKTLEKTVGKAGGSEGDISPGQLRSTVAAGDKTGYVQGRGDFADLARAGDTMLKPLPQSGTAARMAPWMTAGGMGWLGGGMDAKAMLAGAAGAFAPAGLSSLLTSRPVRTALIRQATDPLPMINPATVALSMRQQEQGGQ